MFYSYNHCFTIELLAFQASSIKLLCSLQYCSCLTHFGSIFPFMLPENIRNLWFSDISRRYKRVTLTSTSLILFVRRNYNLLQSFCLENSLLGKETYIFKIWNVKFRIFNFKLKFCILSFHNLGTSWYGKLCTCLFLWRIRFILIFVSLTLIRHAF